MGWDAGLIRRSAVPLVLEGIRRDRPGRPNFVRIIREAEDYSEDADIMRKVAENRMRLDALTRQVEEDFPEDFDPDDFTTELDYIKASIQLGILELTGELEETQTSDEIFDAEATSFAQTALA
jgi:hypothetical protein